MAALGGRDFSTLPLVCLLSLSLLQPGSELHVTGQHTRDCFTPSPSPLFRGERHAGHALRLRAATVVLLTCTDSPRGHGLVGGPWNESESHWPTVTVNSEPLSPKWSQVRQERLQGTQDCVLWATAQEHFQVAEMIYTKTHSSHYVIKALHTPCELQVWTKERE